MKKADKIIVSLFVIIVAGFCILKVANVFSYTYVKTKAQIYLSQKYDAKISDFEIVDYRKAGIYWDDYNIFWLTPEWVDFCFEFEYNDKNIMVNRIDGKFYDDYQLDDIEVWCTEWLQDNVDERITGVHLESTGIAYYIKNSGHKNSYIITEDDAKEFLDNYSYQGEEKCYCLFYYYDETADTDDNHDVRVDIQNEIYNKLIKKIRTSDRPYVILAKNTDIVKHTIKSDNDEWFFGYSL